MLNEANDLDVPVWGTKEISRIINRTERQTFHMLATGALPARKVGERWVTTKRKLMDAIIGDQAAA
ncbi:DNA-binding protein [Jiella pacifica]|uniref:DNA-binding protein n=1 Tax=Jiella pacifica TaxID=2696469 RepID=A0A6N9TCQ2_9HYPH|nr:DNA-binding protein [Jiella pacifica]NDW07459.1 DNA-binding protein [Jiella pacifica]